MNLVIIPCIALALGLVLFALDMYTILTRKPKVVELEGNSTDTYESIRHFYKDGIMPHEHKIKHELEALDFMYKMYEDSKGK
jgi:hypothetical protein